MHYTSLENMKKVYDRYIRDHAAFNKNTVKVIDIGGSNINGSYRDIFDSPKYQYKAVDVTKGKGVDIVLRNPYQLPFKNNSVDIMISGQAFEHIEFFWLTFKEMMRCLREDGICAVIAPSSGPVHRFPVDCYRFYPDAMTALSNWGGCNLIDSWREELGEWKDMVGVFSKAEIKKFALSDITYTPDTVYNDEALLNDDIHTVRGKHPYIEVLKYLHKRIMPKLYVEIGVFKGSSLKLSQSNTIAIDPFPNEELKSGPNVLLYQLTSDDYFEFKAKEELHNQLIDMAFIDGMHHFENVLKDFINIERYASKSTVVVIDDVYPGSKEQTKRKRETIVWMGDVYKIHHCLKQYRPDLKMCILDTRPGGLLMISNLDGGNNVLKEKFNAIVDRYSNETDIIDPYIKRLYSSDAHYTEEIERFLYDRMHPNKPKLSIVLVHYQMERELKRTLYTLSDKYQSDISNDDIEILIMNNEDKPLVLDYEINSNVRIINMDNPQKSPVFCINKGITLASSDLICVMIDGARMASPGLIENSISAAGISKRAIITTMVFHLGPDVQMSSVHNGYDQQAEDELLSSIDWEKDGYKLFDIATISGSLSGGWFGTISESNAITMSRELWNELGGYNEAFTSRGGGLVNLDTYKRACELQNTVFFRLIGEGTFHQVHGGVATNAEDSDAVQKEFYDEYMRIVGKPFEPTEKKVIYWGNINEERCRQFIGWQEEVPEQIVTIQHSEDVPENIRSVNRIMRVLYFILFDRKQIRIKLKKAFKKTRS